jgi:hypothetical protein
MLRIFTCDDLPISASGFAHRAALPKQGAQTIFLFQLRFRAPAYLTFAVKRLDEYRMGLY